MSLSTQEIWRFGRLRARNQEQKSKYTWKINFDYLNDQIYTYILTNHYVTGGHIGLIRCVFHWIPQITTTTKNPFGNSNTVYLLNQNFQVWPQGIWMLDWYSMLFWWRAWVENHLYLSKFLTTGISVLRFLLPVYKVALIAKWLMTECRAKSPSRRRMKESKKVLYVFVSQCCNLKSRRFLFFV